MSHPPERSEVSNVSLIVGTPLKPKPWEITPMAAPLPPSQLASGSGVRGRLPTKAPARLEERQKHLRRTKHTNKQNRVSPSSGTARRSRYIMQGTELWAPCLRRIMYLSQMTMMMMIKNSRVCLMVALSSRCQCHLRAL